MARINSSQANLKGPIHRDENLIDHYLFVVLVWGSVIGAIALFIWMFQVGAWSERRWPSARQNMPVASVQQTAPSQPPRAFAPAAVTVNIPNRIHVDATVRNVTPFSGAASQDKSGPASFEEKTNQFWDHVLKRES